MTLKQIKNKIDNHENIFIDFGDRPTMQNLFDFLYKNNVTFPNNVKMSAYEAWDYFYNYTNKNARPILHIYYNGIINKTGMQLTYKTQIKTYPQFKNIKIDYYFGNED